MPLEAFQLVAERHTTDVWRFCASQVGTELADECYQETMLAALRAYPRLRDPRAVLPWLLRIAQRKAIDLRRASAREALPQEDLDAGVTRPQEVPDGSLVELLRELPAKQRAALAYRFVADLPYREIGALMDTSEAAARRNVHEGIKRLRARLPGRATSKPT